MTVLGGTALAGVLGGNGGNGSPNGGGLLGGLFGGGNNNTCYVTEKEFYQNQLADTNIMYQNLMNTNSALCELSQRVADTIIASLLLNYSEKSYKLNLDNISENKKIVSLLNEINENEKTIICLFKCMLEDDKH